MVDNIITTTNNNTNHFSNVSPSPFPNTKMTTEAY